MISKAWNAYAGDVITQYSFGFNYNHLGSDDFEKSFHDAFMAVSEFGHLTLQFPWMTPVSARWSGPSSSSYSLMLHPAIEHVT